VTTIVSDLEDALRHVLPAVSRDRKHPAALRCVLVERVGDVVRVVATDKRRLAVSERPGELLPAGTRLLLDPTTLAEAVDVADEFPDYERFLAAAEGATIATIDAAELVDAIEREADDGPITLGIDAGELTIGVGHVHVDPGYAHDAAVAAGAGPITVELAGETNPVVFRSPGGDVTILMPVRVATRRS
jgi:hypothetical protein